jgi:hypothetical protein
MPNKASLYDLVGDLVVYRDLDAVDRRLPRFVDSWAEMGLSGPARPRKIEPAYAQAMQWVLCRARKLDAPDVNLAEIVLIGDTALSDGSAFRNLRSVSGWSGWAFIGAERDEELAVAEQDGVYTANRWSALAEFISRLVAHQGAVLDARTAIIMDIDKTAIGARGRNDGAIDRARVAAVEATIAGALGPAYDQAIFRRAYAQLNVPKYHYLTADNQDNLAYICLMLSARLWTLDEIMADLAAERLHSTVELMERVDAIRDQLPTPALRVLHDDVYARVCAGDPTPFKAFRQREYLETVGRMGHLPDDAPLAQRLVEEVCMTREVYDVVTWLRRRGCLVLALSDKPYEATMPSPERVAEGWLPLHRVSTHIVGPSIASLLPTS